MRAVRLQPLTRAKVASLGEEGARWLAGLPGVLAALEQLWSVTIGRSLPGGSASYVAHATTRSGQSAVVKIAISGDDLSDQIRTLRRADGRGYVRLLGADLTRNAVLLEALGISLDRRGRSPQDQLATLVDTLAIAWQPVGGLPLPAPGADKASRLQALVADLWTQLGRPGPERVVRQALSYAEDLRTPDPGELVVVHGDPHTGNLLSVARPRPGAETGYCFVDPDGFVADRAYDLGVALRDWNSRLDGPDARRVAESYCELLARRSGFDRARIWRWGYLERVSTGLYVMSFGLTSMGSDFLRVADRLVD